MGDAERYTEHDYRQELHESGIPQPHAGFITTVAKKGITPDQVADVLHAWRYWTRAQSLEDQRHSPIPPMSTEEMNQRILERERRAIPDFYQWAGNEPGMAQREAERVIDEGQRVPRWLWFLTVVALGILAWWLFQA